MRRYGNADWDAAKQRWAAFWGREPVDRPLAVIFAWDEAFHSPPAYETPEQKHTDPAYQVAKQAHNIRHTHRLGENFNTVRLDLGPVSSGRLFGAKPHYGDQTIWHEPVATSVADALDIMRATDVDAAIERYMAIYDRLDALDVPGFDAMPAQPDPGGPADLLAMLVGPEALCMDLVMEPGLCREALSLSATAFAKLLGRMTARLGSESSDWLNLYHQDGYVTIGEDITAMVSPDMVREFFVPAIRTATQGADNLVFHWHTGAMNTLDAILEMDEVSVLQWTSDINHLTNPPVDHLAAITRIIDAGKRLFVYIDPSHIDAFAKAFPADGVAFGFNADSVAHGEQILGQLEAAYRR